MQSEMKPSRIRFGRFELRLNERRLFEEQRPCPLGTRAFDVLGLLVSRHGEIVTRHELLEAVWPELEVEENNLSVQVSTLRKLLGSELIATIPGRGYQFVGHIDTHAESDATNPVPQPTSPGAVPDRSTSDAARPNGNLPRRLGDILGRDVEIAALTTMLREQSVVTVVGPAGIGKTCLALHTALRIQESFANGGWLVELAALDDPALVAETIAHSLKLALPGHFDPVDELAAQLATRDLLIVIDNAEHLLSTVSRLVSRLVEQTAKVRFLVTSQSLLHIPGEHLLKLGGLTVPESPNARDIADSSAVRLFSRRVRALKEGFHMDTETGHNVAMLCRHLDGIPLAIELAAARVPMFGVAGVLMGLENAPRLLKAGSDPSVRHRSLESALDWSHSLLSDEEQRVFRRLSCFSDGFNVEAMQDVVCDEQIDRWQALDHLGTLVDKSLVTMLDQSPVRYRLLETTRAYAAARLEEADEVSFIRDRHAQAILQLFRRAVRARDMPLLVSEIDNLRQAYNWAMRPPIDPDTAVGLVCLSSVLFAVEGLVTEAIRRIHEVEPLVGPDTPKPVAALFWRWYGRMGVDGRVPVDRCLQAFDRAIELFRELDNPRHLHACLRSKAEALIESGRLDEAPDLLAQASQMEANGLPLADRMRRMRVQGQLDYRRGDFQASAEIWQQAYELARSSGFERYEVTLLTDLARLGLRMGEAGEAVRRYQTLVERSQAGRGLGLTLAYALAGLVTAQLAVGDLPAARSTAIQAVPHLRRSAILLARVDTLALVIATDGWIAQAVRAIGAADRYRRVSGVNRTPDELIIRNKVLSLADNREPLSRAQQWLAEGDAMHEIEVVAQIERCLNQGQCP